MTESVLVVDIDRVGAVMQRIRDLGVHMALDDFGTGYSSLLYLQGLPIDRLKVDRSFVAGLGSPEQDPTIVATVVDLAHKLGLRVVAEGVETEAELRAVGAMGCDEAQGFLLARPGPAHSFLVGHPVLSGTGRPPTVTARRLSRLNMPFWARVQGGELGEQPVVAVTALRVGVVDGRHRHQRAELVRRPPAPRARPASRAAPRRLACTGSADLLDGPVEDVGVDRAPQRRGRPAPDGPDRAEPADREPLDRLAQPSGVEGHSFQHGPDHVAPGSSAATGCGTRPGPPRLSTGDRSPASHGVKRTPPLPGSARAASAVSWSRTSMAASPRPGSPATTRGRRRPTPGCWPPG